MEQNKDNVISYMSSITSFNTFQDFHKSWLNGNKILELAHGTNCLSIV